MSNVYDRDDPAVRELLRGRALPHPRKADRKPRTGLANTPYQQQVRTEETYYEAFEDTVLAHECWFFHPTTSHFTRRHRGQKGYPDYTVFGEGWVAWVELKATSLATGKDGRLAPEQRTYKAFIERAGGEYHAFTLPKDWPAIDDWLIGRTGKEHLRGKGR